MTDTSTRAPQATRLPGWVRVVLILSLAGNLAVLGIVAGFALRHPMAHGPGLNLPVEGFRGLHRAMPEADQAALARDIRARRDDIRAGRRRLAEARSDFIEALRADPFDTATVDAVFADQARFWIDFSDDAREILVARIAEMTPEARAQFADALDLQIREGTWGRRPGKPEPRGE